MLQKKRPGGPKGDVRQCCILVAVKANRRLGCLEPAHSQQQEKSVDSPPGGIQEATSRPSCLVLGARHKSHGQAGASAMETTGWSGHWVQEERGYER